MPNVKLEVWRRGGLKGGSGPAAVRAHKERASLLRALEKTVDVKVTQWGRARYRQPSEVVEIVLALAPVVVPAVAGIIKHWIDSGRMDDVRVTKKDGTEISFGKATPKQIENTLRSLSARGR